MNNGEIKTLEHIIRRMEADDSADAPADAIMYVKNLYRSRLAAPKTSLLRRIAAAIRMEILPDSAVFGERSAEAGATKQLLFDAGEYMIDLRITKAGSHFDIRGQVLGEEVSEGNVRLTRDSAVFEAAIDEVAGFQFTKIEAGQYSLTITAGETEIIIEQLTVN